jgi:hypothetical protein
VAAIAAAIASAALSGAGSYFGNKSAKKAARKQRRQMKRAIDIQRSVGTAALGQQEAAVRRAADKELGGLTSAQTDINRALRERENAMQGSLSQSLANSGLGSTSIGANAQRAVAGDTSRQLSDLMSQLAQKRAGIESNREMQLGGLAGQRGDLLSGLAAQEGDLPIFQGESAGEMVTGALGAGAGAFFGMGGGQHLNLFGMQQQPQEDLLDQIYRPKRSYGNAPGGQYSSSYYQPFVR